MKITQCHISKSISDFPFRKAYGLTEYVDSAKPCVFFGCYTEDDIIAILDHKALAVIVWCGQDSLDFRYWKLFSKSHIKHVSFMKNVWAYLQNYTECKLIDYKNLDPNPVKCHPLGNKIYIYLPKSHPTYHGEEILKQLKTDYEILIGDGSCSQDEWRSGKANEYYNQCFIGLVLSSYAGGGSSIVELGLRGIKCITNVLDLPHVINWKTVEDIENAIKIESENIGKINTELPKAVQRKLDNNNKFLNTEYYGM